MILGIDISPAARKRKTGTEWYAIRLMRTLKNVIPPEVRVILYTPTSVRDALGDMPDTWQERVLAWPFGCLWIQMRLFFELTLRPPTVFFSPANALPLLFFLVPRARRPVFITTIHDTAFDPHPEAYSFWQRRYLRAITSFALAHCRAVMVPTRAVSRDVKKYYSRATADVVVVPHGADHAGNSFSAEFLLAVRRRYRLPQKFLLAIGRLEKKKNTVGVARAFLNAVRNKQIPDDVELLFIGNPGYGWREKTWKQIREESRGRCRRLHDVPQEDLPAIIVAADALLLASWHEGFGFPAVEAMSCGTPVIASTAPALAEVVSDAGLLVSPHDYRAWAAAMAHVYRDEALCELLRRRGYARVAGMTWQAAAQRTWDVVMRVP